MENLQRLSVDRAILVGLNAGVFSKEQTATEESLEELQALLETAGGECVATVLQNRPAPDSHSFVGQGKAEEIAELVKNLEADMVIFDNDLTPSQIKALEQITGATVLDRSALILDIFAQRAKTKEGPASGRAGPVPVSSAPPVRHGKLPIPPWRWHRHPGPRRNQAGNRPAAHPPAD